MPDAFDNYSANFSRLAYSSSGNIWIDKIIHKTYISVDARGTKAGASTVAEIVTSSAPTQEETKAVHLNRPFVYMIIDINTGDPVFMGTVLGL